jgi:hypothetical protein
MAIILIWIAAAGALAIYGWRIFYDTANPAVLSGS